MDFDILGLGLLLVRRRRPSALMLVGTPPLVPNLISSGNPDFLASLLTSVVSIHRQLGSVPVGAPSDACTFFQV
jgi:hypothetical protein